MLQQTLTFLFLRNVCVIANLATFCFENYSLSYLRAAQLQQGKKKFVKIAFVFVLSCFLADRRRRKSRSNFLTLIKGGQLVTFLQCQQKKLMRAKKFYFSCFVCRNTFRKLQTYWVKNQFVVHKFQFGTKIKKSEDLARKFKYFISSRLFLARKFKLPYRQFSSKVGGFFLDKNSTFAPV